MVSKLVLCFLCFGYALGSSVTYKAAVVEVSKIDVNSNRYASLIQEAARENVDILVLPTPKGILSENTYETCLKGLDNYDEIVKSVSSAAKSARLYVAVHLFEKVRCENRNELIRSNLVFDRNGDVVSVYRKPANGATRCNTTTSKLGRFTTDFGLTFGVLMEEDLILNHVKDFDGIKNFIVTDSSLTEKPFLFAKQFPSSWAYITETNVISTNGIFGGKTLKSGGNLVLAELPKHAGNVHHLITEPSLFTPGEDMSQFIIRPLNIEASTEGYDETVCHGRFCCQFHVKTSSVGSRSSEISYGLAVFDGVYDLGKQCIGVQSCSILACAGLYKRSCFILSGNSTNIKFDEITIEGNFTKENSAQFPTVLSTTQNTYNPENFKFTKKDTKDSKHITAELKNTENIISFGVFSRDYSRDHEIIEFSNINNTDSIVLDFSDYISSENVQEFFDYIWIRLRVVIFVVSIYVLEMM